MSESVRPWAAWKREFLMFFGSLKLAIGLLLAIAAASIIGTVLPQDRGPEVITEAAFPAWLKLVLQALDAHDVYHAGWFVALLALLFINLAVCTYLRFPPTWRRYRLALPPAPSPSGLMEVQRLSAPPTPLFLDMLRKRGWRVQSQGEEIVFAEKNKFVRLAPTFIHLSLFLVIAGAIWGGLGGMKNSLPIAVGESVSSRRVVESAFQRGRWHQPGKAFDLRLDAFRLAFRPGGMVKQYYSEVTITPEEGGPPQQRTLWVNEPLIHEGVYFYQSFWGVAGLTYTLDGVTSRHSLAQAKTGGYMSRPFRLGSQEVMLFLRSLEEPAVLVETAQFQPVVQVYPGVPVEMGGHRFEVETYHLFSGLETKTDPGIPLVYLGCGMMIVGLALLPFRHCEAWVRRDDDGWLLGGRTHRGRVILRRELTALAAGWNRLAEAPAEQAGEGAAA
ncbi:MAG: cytochrome c biogenesis protein ResB [Candidatus Sericytochromatia bacterium]|nr:cytochrome c biogenesis protein ResB [Candidatus Sericytochromatia bacterium]